jgi:hypothetical protein
MTKRLWSYRSGDIKENLGIVLLQGIGLVSPTPRTEDIGIDAAVFLNRPENKFLHPESGFYAQIKSSEIDRISFNEEATSHLLNLELPFYIVLVDGPNGRANLHSLNHLFVHFYLNTPKTITLDKSATVISASEDLVGCFNEPLLSWGLQEVFNREFRNMAHDILSAYLEIDMANIVNKNLGIYKNYNVDTNAKPKGIMERKLAVGNKYDPTSDAMALDLALRRFMLHLLRYHPKFEEKIFKLMALYDDVMESAHIIPNGTLSFKAFFDMINEALEKEFKDK